ncbi:hypothetical protein D3C78_1602540 [compost metagenome]
MLVDFDQLTQALIDAAMGAGDQLDLRLAVIGGDLGMREGRAQGDRVRRQRQTAGWQYAQSFLLDAAAYLRQALGSGDGQGLLRFLHSWYRFNCVGAGT